MTGLVANDVSQEQSSDSLVSMFSRMCMIRHVESALLELFDRGLLRGTVHTCIGQEACAVGVVSALNTDTDIIFSNHRGHGHYLAYSADVRGLIAEIMGKEYGVCGGIGGSQHLQLGNFYTNGILGSGLPITVGMALAEKHKDSGAVATAFIGDGTHGEGVLYEAFNLAALWDLPVLFVTEHNRYAQSTPSERQHSGDLTTRAESFDIDVTVEDGMDVQKVSGAAATAIESIRTRSRPQMLFLNTYRFAPHSKGDDFRDIDEINLEKERDPLALAGRVIGESRAQEIEIDTKASVQAIVDELLAE